MARWKIKKKNTPCIIVNAFITITTINNKNNAKYLLEKHKFKHFLPSVISQNRLKNISGKRDYALVATFILMSMASWLQKNFYVCTN